MTRTMKRTRTRRLNGIVRAAAVAAALGGCLVSGLRAEEAGQRWLKRSHLTAGSAVRRAFRETVAQPTMWTVEVRGDGDRVALGVVVSSDGGVLTKASQLKGALTCRLSDGRELPAEIIGLAEDHDLALLKLAVDSLPTVQWSDATDLEMGQWLVTPGQSDLPLSIGVVSASRRAVHAEKTSGVLGIELEAADGPATIKSVMPDSGAERAGLKPGDVILHVAEDAIAGRRSLIDLIRKRQPGETVVLKVRRGEEEQSLEATLSHPFGPFLSRIAMQNQMGGQLSLRRGGFPAVIQHDTVLRPDECGGPVVDLDGRAVGVNIARAGRTESYALPADVVRPLLDELRSGRYAHPPSESSVSLEPQPEPQPMPVAQ